MTDVFGDAIKRQEKVFQEFSSCPIVEITGLVDINGVGAAKFGADSLWSMTLKFDVWRIGSGKLRTEVLTIHRKVSDEEFKVFKSKIKAETIIKIIAHLSDENKFDTPQALIKDVVEENPLDIELKDYLEKLKIPVVHIDKYFGEFTLDRRVNWYSAKVKGLGNLFGKEIILNLSVEQPEELEKTIEVAKALWKEKKTWNQRIGDYAVEKLLNLKNESWHDEDEKEVTAKKFKGRMKLESITIYPDGSFEFWHDDGDLFWGHSIQISGNLSDGPTDADIPG